MKTVQRKEQEEETWNKTYKAEEAAEEREAARCGWEALRLQAEEESPPRAYLPAVASPVASAIAPEAIIKY